MIQEEIFNSLLETIETNKKAKEEGKVTSLLFPFERLPPPQPTSARWRRSPKWMKSILIFFICCLGD